MTGQNKEPPSGGNREGVRKYQHPKLTKPVPFPQEPLLWQARCESYQRVQDDPTPVNIVIARVVAEQWKAAATSEVPS